MVSDAEEAVGRSGTALVTGGGGFLGRAIVERLVRRGYRVRSLSRGRYPELDALGVESYQGDITDTELLGRACAGCDMVFHAAAMAGVWVRYGGYERVNVDGTEACLEAARKQGVARFVHTSSPSVVFNGEDMEGVDESVEPSNEVRRSNYSFTKLLAENSALSANSGAMKTIALRPHLIWGPRDNHIVPRIVAQGRAGKLRIVGSGDNVVDTTYIDNAADAHLCALAALDVNPQAAGRAYFISNGEPINLWEIINGILAAAGLPPVTKRVSRCAAFVAGAVLEGVHGVLRLKREPRMTRFVAEELATSHWFDISAARRELGYEPKVSIAEGLQRLKAWIDAGKPYGG